MLHAQSFSSSSPPFFCCCCRFRRVKQRTIIRSTSGFSFGKTSKNIKWTKFLSSKHYVLSAAHFVIMFFLFSLFFLFLRHLNERNIIEIYVLIRCERRAHPWISHEGKSLCTHRRLSLINYRHRSFLVGIKLVMCACHEHSLSFTFLSLSYHPLVRKYIEAFWVRCERFGWAKTHK